MGGGHIISRAASGPKLPLKVLFGDREVSRPNLLAIRVGNAGQQEIRSDDFDKAITFTFSSSHVLAYDVVDTANRLITPTFAVDTSRPDVVTLNPLLLNSREWVQLQFVTDGPLERPIISARVAGETATISSVRDPAKMFKARLFFTGIVVVCFIGEIFLALHFSDTPFAVTNEPGLLLILLMFGMTAGGLLALNGGYRRSAWQLPAKEPPKSISSRRYTLVEEESAEASNDPHHGGDQAGGDQATL